MRPDCPVFLPAFKIAPVRQQRCIKRVAITGLRVISTKKMSRRANLGNGIQRQIILADRNRPMAIQQLLQNFAINHEFLKTC